MFDNLQATNGVLSNLPQYTLARPSKNGGSDFDAEDYGCEEEYSIVTNLTCPKCQSFVQVYYPREDQRDESTELATPLQKGEEATS